MAIEPLVGRCQRGSLDWMQGATQLLRGRKTEPLLVSLPLFLRSDPERAGDGLFLLESNLCQKFHRHIEIVCRAVFRISRYPSMRLNSSPVIGLPSMASTHPEEIDNIHHQMELPLSDKSCH